MRRLGFVVLLSVLIVGAAHAEWHFSRPDDFQRNDGVEGDLRGIAFADDMHGWAVGDNGTILHTADGGKTWVKQAMPQPPENANRWLRAMMASAQLWWVTSLDANSAWIAGSGLLLRTKDAGQTWESVDPGTRTRFVDITFLSPEVGYVAGDNKTLLRTADGGDTWTSVVSGKRARAGDNRTVYEAVAFASPKIGWIVGSTGTVVMSEDGGESWETPAQDTGAVENLYGATFTSPTDGWIVGQEATILHTTDGGKTWARVDNDAQKDYYDLADIAFSKADPAQGWIVGDGGTILHTSDGGKTWKKEASGVTDALYAVAVTPSGSAFVVGAWGIILTNAPPPVAER